MLPSLCVMIYLIQLYALNVCSGLRSILYLHSAVDGICIICMPPRKQRSCACRAVM